ncbi:acetyl/propionyl/methylcrotonyl-CoA carboxylase subunit alpha [Taklimakanibacter deserti]|uniref:acetyl/propionyl/methylcrotonyl-CoA carboxylase subunit alpha n=1 Tax=Taklimakanibacter deserti TaxID=2267839 RepID=UPI000E6460F9
MLKSVLIANRGEIACRVIRTARRMGLRTIAVYSDADADALHVAQADEAVRIGGPLARDSYLKIDAVLDAAKKTGAEAIHPGYGFLSENANFAEACAKAKIVFVGPPASAIRAMGGKSEAKALMAKAQVPLVPGYHGEDQSPDVLEKAADKIGYPVLIKASAGGGGKGMKVAQGKADFRDQLASAKREALSSFGDDRVLIEKYLTKPRHVEIQVFADAHGHCVYLFERDCSIQRRHQKVIEEAPAPGMTAGLRQRMGEAAVTAAKSIGYVGAGTVEFLLDEDGSFYFMEMNTRLQVEHPVTEFITGLDLVEWQLRVASGEKLPLAQDQLAINGHAFEVRLYAEDPDRDFLPQTGTITHLSFPPENGHVRIDTGITQGKAISTYYDPMIAKLIVWDLDRPQALAQLRRALAQTEIGGLVTNTAFLAKLAANKAFAKGDVDTGFIGRHEKELLPSVPAAPDDALVLAATGILLRERQKGTRDPWSLMDGWRHHGGGHDHLTLIDVSGGQTAHKLVFDYAKDGFLFHLKKAVLPVSATLSSSGKLTADLGGRRLSAGFASQSDDVTLFLDGVGYRLKRAGIDLGEEDGEAAALRIAAPMPGRIIAVHVAAGKMVEKGTPLIVLEAMKMEHTLKAGHAGKIEYVGCKPGDQIREGQELLRFAAPA